MITLKALRNLSEVPFRIEDFRVTKVRAPSPGLPGRIDVWLYMRLVVYRTVKFTRMTVFYDGRMLSSEEDGEILEPGIYEGLTPSTYPDPGFNPLGHTIRLVLEGDGHVEDAAAWFILPVEQLTLMGVGLGAAGVAGYALMKYFKVV